MAYENIIAELQSIEDSVRAVVRLRLNNVYEVEVWDTDADAVVGVKYLSDAKKALIYAELCMGGLPYAAKFSK